MNINLSDSTFKPGDSVVLVNGPNVGTSGVFLRLAQDLNWAEIKEADIQGFTNRVRNHPLVWLNYAACE